MPDYTVTITVNVPIVARDDAQADERAESLEELFKLGIALVQRPTWAGDTEITYEVEEA